MLVRSALVGSALATNPVGLVFKPMSAYAATCMCRGQSCACGTACCDGYTEFCCTLTGSNQCPSGTVAGGWWRAEGSGLCGGASRYYLDCNQTPDQPSCPCTCAANDCNHRVTCCVHFRYGQCHQEFAQLGAIVCRVVTCTPPWQFDQSCTTVDAEDDSTASHDAPCLHNEEEDIVRATYVRRTGYPQVFALFDGGNIVPVTNFLNTEEIFKRTLNVEFVDYYATQRTTDGAGTVRNVWVVDDGSADMLGLPK